MIQNVIQSFGIAIIFYGIFYGVASMSNKILGRKTKYNTNFKS